MRPMLKWTLELDARLCMLRHAGMTWDAIALAMNLGRNTVLERGRKIGARRLRPSQAIVEAEHRDRPARPPGHPLTWGLLTDGTALDGAAYPFPVFL